MNPLDRLVKDITTTLLSTQKATTHVSSVETWAVANTFLAAQQMMLAVTSYGMTSCPMEGFDSVRLANLLDIPSYVFLVMIDT